MDSFGATWLIVRVIGATIGLRVTEKEERAGLDLVAHGERAFSLTGLMPMVGLDEGRAGEDPADRRSVDS